VVYAQNTMAGGGGGGLGRIRINTSSGSYAQAPTAVFTGVLTSGQVLSR
jgi:hypothetical protein